MVEGIIYRYRCGIAWRDLPEVFRPWQTVWTWHQRMAAEGTWDNALATLTAAADAAGLVDWSPGQAGDSPMFLPLMAQLRVGRAIGRPRTRPDAVRGDKAYSSRAIRGHLRTRGNKAVIPEPDDQKGHRKRRGSRGGRPVGLDATDYKNRNVIERHYCHIKQWRGLATRYDKHAIIYRAAVSLNAVDAWARWLSGPS